MTLCSKSVSARPVWQFSFQKICAPKLSKVTLVQLYLSLYHKTRAKIDMTFLSSIFSMRSMSLSKDIKSKGSIWTTVTQKLKISSQKPFRVKSTGTSLLRVNSATNTRSSWKTSEEPWREWSSLEWWTMAGTTRIPHPLTKLIGQMTW